MIRHCNTDYHTQAEQGRNAAQWKEKTSGRQPESLSNRLVQHFQSIILWQ